MGFDIPRVVVNNVEIGIVAVTCKRGGANSEWILGCGGRGGRMTSKDVVRKRGRTNGTSVPDKGGRVGQSRMTY